MPTRCPGSLGDISSVSIFSYPGVTARGFFEDRDLQRTFAGNRSLMLDVGATTDFGIANTVSGGDRRPWRPCPHLQLANDR